MKAFRCIAPWPCKSRPDQLGGLRTSYRRSTRFHNSLRRYSLAFSIDVHLFRQVIGATLHGHFRDRRCLSRFGMGHGSRHGSSTRKGGLRHRWRSKPISGGVSLTAQTRVCARRLLPGVGPQPGSLRPGYSDGIATILKNMTLPHNACGCVKRSRGPRSGQRFGYPPERRREMRRIYFRLHNVQSAREIIDELLLRRIEWRHIHCCEPRRALGRPPASDACATQ
jgi:hypothetical protein